MGTYATKCASCSRVFQWFSGDSPLRLCADCQAKIEEAAVWSASNMGAVENAWHPDYGQILKDKELTPAGLKMFEDYYASQPRTVGEEMDAVRHGKVITDPFEHQQPSSMHEAYRWGYDQAYSEIRARLGHRRLK